MEAMMAHTESTAETRGIEANSRNHLVEQPLHRHATPTLAQNI